MNQNARSFIPLFAAAIAGVFFLSGCATSRIDWNSRIGNYTYDQAIVDMGPPERSATLSDGRTVSEWLTFRGRSGGHYYSPGFYSPYYGSFGGWYRNEPSFPDQFIRLTFSSEGRLEQWKRVAK